MERNGAPVHGRSSLHQIGCHETVYKPYCARVGEAKNLRQSIIRKSGRVTNGDQRRHLRYLHNPRNDCCPDFVQHGHRRST